MTPQELHDITAPVLAKHPEARPFNLQYGEYIGCDNIEQYGWYDGLHVLSTDIAAALFESCWVRWLAVKAQPELGLMAASKTWNVHVQWDMGDGFIGEGPTLLEALAAALLSLPESTREEQR